MNVRIASPGEAEARASGAPRTPCTALLGVITARSTSGKNCTGEPASFQLRTSALNKRVASPPSQGFTRTAPIFCGVSPALRNRWYAVSTRPSLSTAPAPVESSSVT